MAVNVVEIPVDVAFAAMVHNAVVEQFAELVSELKVWDKELYEFCAISKECKLQLLKISLESAAAILRQMLDEAIDNEWKTILEAYEQVTKGTNYHT